MAELPAFRFVFAFAVGVFAAVVSRRLRFLSKGGAISAGLLAALLLGFGSLQWLLPMVLFFLASSLLSGITERLAPDAADAFEKGNERDAFQVLANGGAGALLVLLAQREGGEALYVAYLSSLAAAAADTWGTELGMMSRTRPRLITTFAPVPAGTSGAVSGAGLFGGLAGTVVIAATGSLWLGRATAGFLPAIIISGLFGALVDSVLGATFQAQYRCAACGALTERTQHCGSATSLHRGARWLTNDMVNVCCNAAGAVGGYLLACGSV